MWRRTLFVALLWGGFLAFSLGQVKPPDAPLFKPPADIRHPKSADEPPGAPEKTTGTVQSYVKGRSLILTTADGSRSFDLAHATLTGDTQFDVGDQVTVIRILRPNGEVTLALAKESPPE